MALQKAAQKAAQKTVQELFLAGDYQAALLASIDHPRGRWDSKDLIWVLGALCFVGRLTEAQTLFQQHLPRLSLERQVAARFFLSLGLIRVSEYRQARQHLILNLRAAARCRLTARGLFFAHQGVAFYRYYRGRWKGAERSSRQALRAALNANFLYGRVLGTDLRGHLYVQQGLVPAGLKALKQACHLARSMGNQGVARAIEIAHLCYQAQFGLGPGRSLERLRRELKSRARIQDNYSQANLLLELARQLVLRGQWQEAWNSLDLASREIYSHQNRRQEATLNLRYAHLCLMSRDPGRGLHFIRSGQRALHPQVDRMLELALTDLEAKLLLDLGMSEEAARLQEQLIKRGRGFGGQVHRRMMGRSLSKQTSLLRTGDPLGDLHDFLRATPSKGLQQTLDSPYLGLLMEARPELRGQEFLWLDLVPGTLTVGDRLGVHHTEGLTPRLRRLLLRLSLGESSQEQLLREVWGYRDPHPLRHPPVLHQAILSLRKLLGPRAEWIQTTEQGYRLRQGLCLYNEGNQAPPPAQSSAPAEEFLNLDANLNHRQHQMLREGESRRYWSVPDYQRHFKTSEATALRDLSDLCRRNYMLKIGKARATRYMRVQREAGGQNY